MTRSTYFLPAKVQLNDIREEKDGNLFLLTEADRNTIIEILSNPHIPDGRYSKNKQFKKMMLDKNKVLEFNGYDVVKLNGEFYVVYKGMRDDKHVGAGGEAVVKSVQNLRTGAWEAIKIISQFHTSATGEEPIVTSEDDLKKRVEQVKEEYVGLQLADMAIGILPRRGSEEANDLAVSRKGVQDAILMRFAPGVDLFDYIQRYQGNKVPASELIDIAIQMCELVQALHNQNRIHRDLKLENFRYDPASKKLKLVDFSLSANLDAEGKVHVEHSLSSPGYRAKETLEHDDFTKKSDVFALGACIAGLLYLTDEEELEASTFRDEYKLRDRDFFVTKYTNPMTHDKYIIDEFYKVSEALMAAASQRPDDLTDTINYLKSVKAKLNEKQVIGIFNIDDYRKADFFGQQDLIRYYQNFTEIVLIDSNSIDSIRDEIEIQRELAKKNVVIRERIFLGELPDVTVQIKRYYASLSPNVTPEFKTIHDLSTLEKIQQLVEFDSKSIKSNEDKEYFIYKILDAMLDLQVDELRGRKYSDLQSLLKLIKIYHDNNDSNPSIAVTSVIKALLDEIDNVDQQLKSKEKPSQEYLHDKADAYQVLAEWLNKLDKKSEAKECLTCAVDLLKQDITNASSDGVKAEEIKTTQQEVELLKNIPVIEVLVNSVAAIVDYKEKKASIKVRTTTSPNSLQDDISILETLLANLRDAQESLRSIHTMQVKKYLELCSININYLTTEISSLRNQIALAEIDEAVRKQKQARPVTIFDNKPSEAQKRPDETQQIKNIRNEAQRLFAFANQMLAVKANVKQAQEAEQITQALQAFEGVVSNLDSIPINKRQTDDVLMLAKIASSLLMAAEQDKDDAIIFGAKSALDKAQYFLPLKAIKGSPNLIFACVVAIAKAYDELCSYYLKRGNSVMINELTASALNFLHDIPESVLNNVEASKNAETVLASLKSNFEMMQSLDLESLKQDSNNEIPKAKEENQKLSQNSVILAEVTAAMIDPNRTSQTFKEMLRKMQDVPVEDRTINYYTTLLEVTNAFGLNLQRDGRHAQALKILNWGLQQANKIMPHDDAISISSLFLNAANADNNIVAYLTARAIAYYHLAMNSMEKHDYNGAIYYFGQGSMLLINIPEDRLAPITKLKFDKFVQAMKIKEGECIDHKANEAIESGYKLAAKFNAEQLEKSHSELQADSSLIKAELQEYPAETTVISADGVMRLDVVQAVDHNDEEELQRKLKRVPTHLVASQFFSSDAENQSMTTTLPQKTYAERVADATQSRDKAQAYANKIIEQNRQQKEYFDETKRRGILTEAAQHDRRLHIVTVAATNEKPISRIQNKNSQEQKLKLVDQNKESIELVSPITPADISIKPKAIHLDMVYLQELAKAETVFALMRDQYKKYAGDLGLKGFRYKTYDEVLKNIQSLNSSIARGDLKQAAQVEAKLEQRLTDLFKQETKLIKTHRNYFANFFKGNQTTLETLLTELQSTLVKYKKDLAPYLVPGSNPTP